MYCFMVSAIASTSSSFKYSWFFVRELDTPYPMEVDTPYSAIDQNNGLEVSWILRIQVLDTVYWGFLGVGTTLDIFQNIIMIPYLEYDVLSPLDTVYLSYSSMVFGKRRHGYAVSSLMDMAYWSSE
ncbi:hypothetical protein Tco_0515169 [Tanacetum coccineum]